MKHLFVAVSAADLMCQVCGPAHATVQMGTDLADFAALSSSGLTNSPTSTINGSVGVYPGSSITGFDSSPGVPVTDPQVTSGFVDATTATGSSDNAMLAQADLTATIGVLNGLPATALSNPTLGGAGQPSLGPGVYSGATNVTGAFKLQGNGTPNEQWVFLTNGLVFNVGSGVTIADPGTGASVFWVDASSVAIDSLVSDPTTMLGNVLALTSISMGTDATDTCGRLLANTGAVTLLSDTISIGCTGAGLPTELASSGGLNGGSSPVTNIPEPSSLIIFGGLLLTGLALRRA